MDILPPLACTALGAVTEISQCTWCANRRIGASGPNRVLPQAAPLQTGKGLSEGFDAEVKEIGRPNRVGLEVSADSEERKSPRGCSIWRHACSGTGKPESR